MSDDELIAKLNARVGEVLWNAANYPERVQSRMLGQNTAPLREKVVAAALAVFREHTAPTGDEREACRWFHRWEGTEHFAGMFKLVSRCRKCDLHKIEDVLTERVEYGWYTPALGGTE